MSSGVITLVLVQWGQNRLLSPLHHLHYIYPSPPLTNSSHNHCAQTRNVLLSAHRPPNVRHTQGGGLDRQAPWSGAPRPTRDGGHTSNRCICENEEDPFKVSISPNKDVFDLKTLITETCFNLKLTKVRHIMSSMRTSWPDYVSQINISHAESTILAGQFQPGPGDVRLFTVENICDVWPMKPSKSFVHVFVGFSTSL